MNFLKSLKKVRTTNSLRVFGDVCRRP